MRYADSNSLMHKPEHINWTIAAETINMHSLKVAAGIFICTHCKW